MYVKFSSMKNMFPGFLNIFEHYCNKKLLTKSVGDVKLKARWKVTERQWWKLQKEPLIRYLHGARVTEEGITYTHTQGCDKVEKTWMFPWWYKTDKDDAKKRRKEKNEIMKFKTIHLHEDATQPSCFKIIM